MLKPILVLSIILFLPACKTSNKKNEVVPTLDAEAMHLKGKIYSSCLKAEAGKSVRVTSTFHDESSGVLIYLSYSDEKCEVSGNAKDNASGEFVVDSKGYGETISGKMRITDGATKTVTEANMLANKGSLEIKFPQNTIVLNRNMPWN